MKMRENEFEKFLEDGLCQSVENRQVEKNFEKNVYMQIVQQEHREEQSMKKTKYVRRVFVIAAIMICATASVFGLGKAAGYISRGVHVGNKIPTDAELMKDLGAVPTFLEKFSNGYEFQEYGKGTTDLVDESGNAIKTAKQITLDYQDTKNGRNPISFMITQVFEQEDEKRETGITQVDLGSIEGNLYEMEYKFVPPNYELTEEDERKNEAGELEISYGSDTVIQKHMTSVSWKKDGLEYSLLYGGQGEVCAEELIEMAKQVIK